MLGHLVEQRLSSHLHPRAYKLSCHGFWTKFIKLSIDFSPVELVSNTIRDWLVNFNTSSATMQMCAVFRSRGSSSSAEQLSVIERTHVVEGSRSDQEVVRRNVISDTGVFI